MSNLLVIPIEYTSPLIESHKTAASQQIALKSAGVPIPEGAKPITVWIAEMNGAGYAEMIWTINDITPDFIVSLFINNPTANPIQAIVTITFVVLFN